MREEGDEEGQYSPKIRRMSDSTRAKELRRRRRAFGTVPYQKETPVESPQSLPASKLKKRKQEQNPDALTSATHIQCNILQPECSLVQEFAAAKGKKNSAKYTAALFDHRGWTVIVVYQKASDDYILAWAEPEAKDHYRDRLLNSIAFDDANTLAMSYYHGNRTFKYRFNLTSKNLRRS